MTRPIAQTRRNALLTRSAICGVLGALAIGASPALAANWANATVAASNGGAPNGATAGSVTTVNMAGVRAVIDWTSFNIANGETVNFQFSNPNAIVLNRVTGGSFSSIDGVLNGCLGVCNGSNPGGSVWIYNANGVVFGANARVNVGNLLATTASLDRATDISAGGFLAASTNTFTFTGATNGTNGISVADGAQIRTTGSLALVAPFVTTAGVGAVNASDGDVLYGAAESFTIQFAADASNDLDLVSFSVPAATGTSSTAGLNIGGSTTAGRVFASVVSKSAVTSQLLLGGTVQANAVSGANGDIILAAGAGIDAGGVLGTATGGTVNLTASAGLTADRDVLVASSGTTAVSTATAGQDLTLNGASVQLANGSAGRDLIVTDTAGGVTITSSATAGDDLEIYATGAVNAAGATLRSTGTGVDDGRILVRSNGGSVSVGSATTEGIGAAAGDVIIRSVFSTATLGSGSSSYNLQVSGTTANLTSGDAAHDLIVIASSGVATITTSATAGDDITINGTAGVLATNATLTATGLGAADSADVNVFSLNGAVAVRHARTLGTGATVGDVKLQSQTNMGFTSITSSRDATVTSVTGSITQASGSGVITATNLVATASGAINLNGANAVTNLRGSSGSALFSFRDADSVNFDGNVTAGTLSLDVGGAITQSGGIINAGTLNATAVQGITLNQANTFTNIGTVTNSTAGGVSLTEADGIDISGGVTANGQTITLVSTLGHIWGGGIVGGTLNATAATGIDVYGSDVDTIGGLSSTSGDVRYTDDDGFDLAGAVTATGQLVWLQANNNASITQSAGGITASTLVVLASSSATLGGANDVTNLASISVGGDFTFRDINGFGLSTGVSASNNISLTADAGSITQTGGSITGYSLTASATTGITLTQAANDVYRLTLANATSGGVNYTDSNNFLVTGAMTASGQTVSLRSLSSGISQDIGSVITADVLTATAQTGIILTQDNAVNSLGVVDAGTGGFLYRDVDNIALTGNISSGGTVSIVSNTGSISQTGGAITANALAAQAVTGMSFNQANAIGSLGPLSNTGSGGILVNDVDGFNITGNISNIGRTVQLTNTGAITQSGGVITAGTLTTSATGGLSLTQANMIDSLGAVFVTSGDFSLTNNKSLAVSGAVTARNIAITTTDGALTVQTGMTAGAGLNLVGDDGVTANASLFGSTGVTVTATHGDALVAVATANGAVTVQALDGDATLRQASLGGAINEITVSATGTATLGADSQADISTSNYVNRVGGVGSVNVISSGGDARVFLNSVNAALTTVDANNSVGTAAIGVANGFTAGTVDGRNVVLTAPNGTINITALTVQGGDYTVTGQNFAGSVLNPGGSMRNVSITDTLGGLTLSNSLLAGGDLTIVVQNGGTLTTSSLLRAGNGSGVGDLSVTASNLSLGAVEADGNVTLDAGTGVILASSVSVDGDYTLTGGSFSNPVLTPGGARAGRWILTDTSGGLALGALSLDYVGDLVVNVGGTLTAAFGIRSIAGSLTINAGTIDAQSVSAGTSLNITSAGDTEFIFGQANNGGIYIDAGGAVTISNLAATTDIDLTAADDVDIFSWVAASDGVSLVSTGGSLAVAGIILSTGGTGQDLTLSSAGDLTFGAATAAAITTDNAFIQNGTGVISIEAGGDLALNLDSADHLGDLAAQGDVAMTVKTGDIYVNTATAQTGSLSATAQTGAIRVDDVLTSALDLTLTANSLFAPSLEAARDLTVTTTNNLAVFDASAGDDITLTSTAGGVSLWAATLTGAAADTEGDGRSLTIAADRDISLGAGSENDITNQRLVRTGAGTVSLTSTTGDVDIFLLSSNAEFTTVSGNTITGIVKSGDLAFGTVTADSLFLGAQGNLTMVNRPTVSNVYRARASGFGGQALAPAAGLDHFEIYATGGGLVIGNDIAVDGYLIIMASSSLSIGGDLSAGSHIRVESHGGMTFLSGASLTSAATGDAILVASDGSFVNNAGANALSAANGRWLVYTQSQGAPMTPGTNTFGGLDGKSFYDAIYGFGTGNFGTTPNAGNRFVYAYRPYLTITPNGQTVTYTGAIPTLTATITGLVNGDLAADAWSGAPTISGATKNVGVYNLVAGMGSVTSDMNYGFYLGTGLLTINPKALTGTVLVDDKTYDGNASATGSISLGGVVAGDTVSAGASYAFDNKNAGTGKAITVTGVALSGADAGNYTLDPLAAAVADILQKALTGTVTANNKTYDGTAAATGSVSLSGVVGGDDVSVSGGTYAFANETAGVGKTVTASGVGLTGADAGNYTLDPLAAAIADILKKSLTGTLTASSKTYDGATTATGAISLTGVIAGDTVSAGGTYAFADENAGVGKTVSASGVILSGADAANYDLTAVSTAIADILRKSLTGTLTASTKTYDGTTAATGAISLTGVIAGDSVSAGGTYGFADANAGVGKTVTASGVSLSGADAANYDLTSVSTAIADILRKSLTGTLTASSKTYDGTTSATGSISLTGVIAGDDVTAGGGTYAFADANAGVAKTVTATGFGLLGADAANYDLTAVSTAVADILRKALTGTLTASSKTYDGTTSATGSISLTGAIAGDDVAAGGTYAFADKNAGVGKTVTATGVGLTGADAGNYDLTAVSTAIADILRKALTGTVVVQDKTYDGTTAATGSVTLAGVIAGDSVSAGGAYAFADADAGAGKTVTVSGVSLNGADAGNYVLSPLAPSMASILRRAVSIQADDQIKRFGQSDPALTWTVVSGSLVQGDAVSGALARAGGEEIGTYVISQGTLSLSQNYDLTFTPGLFVIQALPTIGSDASDALRWLRGPAGYGLYADPAADLLLIDERGNCPEGQSCPQVTDRGTGAGAF